MLDKCDLDRLTEKARIQSLENSEYFVSVFSEDDGRYIIYDVLTHVNSSQEVERMLNELFIENYLLHFTFSKGELCQTNAN